MSMRSLAGGLALLAATAAWGQLSKPALIVESPERRPHVSLNNSKEPTVVIHGDKLDLGATYWDMVMSPAPRTRHLVFIARELTVGPRSVFWMNGRIVDNVFLGALHGGDLYLVADTLVIDGAENGQLTLPAERHQRGGFAPRNPQWQAPRGRVFVAVNNVRLAEPYMELLAKSMANVAGDSAVVPPAALAAIARGFSSSNPVQRPAAGAVRWMDLAESYRYWLSKETPQALAIRELKLKTHDSEPGQLPDKVGTLADASQWLSSALLAPWYNRQLPRIAALANTALLRKDYDQALQYIQQAQPLGDSATEAVRASPEYAAALSSLALTETELSKMVVVETVTLVGAAQAPVNAVVVRDLAARRIKVLPNQLVFEGIRTGPRLSLGFATLQGSDVRLRMRARLSVDPALLQQVRQRFAKPGTRVEVLGLDELKHEALNLGLGAGVLSDATQLHESGIVEFDLVVPGAQLVPLLVRLGQPHGIDASMGWRYAALPDEPPRTATVNVALERTDLTLPTAAAQATNPFDHDVVVDYVMDGSSVRVLDTPLRIKPGKTADLGCPTPAGCWVPSAAVRHKLDTADPNAWFLSTPDISSVQQVRVVSQLADNDRRGGPFRRLELDVRFRSSPGAEEQRKLITLTGPRLSINSEAMMTVRASDGGGSLEVSGRAYYGEDAQHRQDVAPFTTQGRTIVVADDRLVPLPRPNAAR